MEITFWIALFAFIHSYILYPIIIQFLAKNDFEKEARFTNYQPTVHILIAAYNEEAVIGEKLKSIFQTTYNKNFIQIHIGSDASTDKTDEIIQQFANKEININFKRFGGRSGKPHIINTLADLISKENENDIFIITDANVIFTPATISELVKKLQADKVGLVGSIVKNFQHKNNQVADVESIYINRENKIKLAESNYLKAVIGVFGGCFAVKAQYFTPTPQGFIADDFFTTLEVIRQKKQVLIAEKAIVYEDLPDSMQVEFKRKRRISAGNFQNMKHFWKLWVFPFTKAGFGFFSHKILRWLSPIFMLIIFINGSILFFNYQKGIYVFAVLAFLYSVLIMFLKKVFPNSFIFKNKLISAIAYFLYMNLALLFGLFDFLKGIKTNTWERTERTTSSIN